MPVEIRVEIHTDKVLDSDKKTVKIEGIYVIACSLITPVEACAQYITVFDHFIGNGRAPAFWTSTYFILHAGSLTFPTRPTFIYTCICRVRQ